MRMATPEATVLYKVPSPGCEAGSRINFQEPKPAPRATTPHDEWPAITPNYGLISTRNNPCHTSTEHVSSPSAQETSNVWSDGDGGHINSAERCAGTHPAIHRNSRHAPPAA